MQQEKLNSARGLNWRRLQIAGSVTPAARNAFLDHTLKSVVLFSVVALSICAARPGVAESRPARTVLDGVYVHPQADRGAEHFANYCARCHNGSDALLLSSDDFFNHWREERLSTLFNYIQAKMPRNAPGSLDEWDYLDILVYILQINGYPEGSSDLLPSQLKGILLVGNEGPQPLPAGTPVYVTGCLNHSKDGWEVTSADGPWRSQYLPETAASFSTLAAQPLGSETVLLGGKLDFAVSPDNRVYVRGPIRHQNGESKLDVSVLQVLNPSCGSAAKE
jgi:hypothetical protein